MELIDKYINHISNIRRYSEKTVRNYIHVLEDFTAFIAPAGADNVGITDEYILESLTPNIIRSYEVHLLNDRKLIPRTVNLHISVLSGFCKFLIKDGRLNSNPVRTVARPKVPKRLPAFYRESEMENYFGNTEIFVTSGLDIAPEDFLEAYTESRPRGFRPEQDEVWRKVGQMASSPEKFRKWLYERKLRRLIVAILYSTGMRRAELVSLKVGDIGWARKSVKVLGKGDKMREIPLTSSLCEEISLYLQAVTMICGEKGPGGPLLVTYAGRGIYPEFVDRAVGAELEEAEGFTGKKSPHVLRHTLATELLEKGTDLYSIKELLGHSSLAATQVYTHNSIEKLKNVYKTAHPRAKNGGKNGD